MTGNRIIDEHVDVDKLNLITEILEAGKILDNQKISMVSRMGIDGDGNIIGFTNKYGAILP
jgi:hypothetical protein